MSVSFTKNFANEAELSAFLVLIGGTAAETTKTVKADAPAKPAAKPAAKKATVTQSQMQTALNEVKEKFGVPEAKTLINEVGGVKKMDDIPEDKYEEVYKAAQAKLEEDETADEGGIAL